MALHVRAIGGKIGCFSLRVDADSVMLFDGAEGLFYISDNGYPMYAVVTGITPAWFAKHYTDKTISVADALALTSTP